MHPCFTAPGLCKNNARVRTMGGVVSGAFGTIELGGSILWLFFFFSVVWGWRLCFGDADDCPATRLPVQACRSSYMDRALRWCHCLWLLGARVNNALVSRTGGVGAVIFQYPRPPL